MNAPQLCVAVIQLHLNKSHTKLERALYQVLRDRNLLPLAYIGATTIPRDWQALCRVYA